jgi:hypothetical protein
MWGVRLVEKFTIFINLPILPFRGWGLKFNTMNKAKAILIVAALFESYPTVNEFHVTTDGQAFAEKQNAESHAISLDKKEPVVVYVSREDMITETTVDTTGEVGKSAEQIAVDEAAALVKTLTNKLKFSKAENKPAVQEKLDAAVAALAEATAKLPA